MKELINAGLSFVALAVVLAVGVGIVVMANDSVVTIVGNGTILDTVITNVGTALTTFTALLPILALAIVGGLALAYVLGFFRSAQ
jgi:hypothetical protein